MDTKQKSAKPQLSAVFPYLNNHATVALEELRTLRPDVDVQFFYWGDLPTFRSENNWQIPDGAQRLSFLRPIAVLKHLASIIKSEHVYLQGFSVPRVLMAGLLLILILFGRCKNILIASEGLKKQPGVLKKGLLPALFNSPKITHLGIGYNSSRDFKNLGFSRWSFRRFCYCERYPQVIKAPKTVQYPVKILTVGQLIQRKNHKRLLKAVSRLDDPSKVSVFIAGSGELSEDLQKMAEKLNIRDQIEFLGFCDERTLNLHFGDSDIFVLQSHYDGWGVVVAHAAHFSLPIFVSSGVRSGKDFLVVDGVNGFIANSDEDFFSQLQQVICNTDQLLPMGQRSKEEADLWRLENVANRLSDFLDDPAVSFPIGPLSSV